MCAVTRTKLFKSNQSQAMRLPKDVAFPDGLQEVVILRDGPRRIVVPADSVWDDFFGRPGVDIGEREQPEHQEREDF
jgi:antitoxin VapB